MAVEDAGMDAVGVMAVDVMAVDVMAVDVTDRTQRAGRVGADCPDERSPEDRPPVGWDGREGRDVAAAATGAPVPATAVEKTAEMTVEKPSRWQEERP